MSNPDRRLRYTCLQLPTAKQLYVFADGSFANSKDASSQIVFVTMIGNEEMKENAFTLRENTITYSSTKCHRVTGSALASELYAMAQGAEMT